MMDVLYLILFYGFRFIILLIPFKWIKTVIKGLTFVVYRLDKKHYKIAKTNLDLAYEKRISEVEKEEIIKACYMSLGMSLVDFVKNQGISKKVLLKKVTFENDTVLVEALAKGRKVILVTAHYSNWELLPLSLAAKYGPLTGVGRKLDSSSMDNILKENREQFDIEMLDKKGAMRDMISVLKKNRMLGLLVDQNTSNNEGILVDFFDKPVRHTPSAAILARRFDALILPVFICTDGNNHYTITFYKTIHTAKTENKEQDILDSVQKQAKITEEVIREKPEEWFWLHKRWKNKFEHCYD